MEENEVLGTANSLGAQVAQRMVRVTSARHMLLEHDHSLRVYKWIAYLCMDVHDH